MRLLVFCEAEGDFCTVAGLVDRVLREEGPTWVREHLEHYPIDHLRTWVGDGERAFFDVHLVYRYAERYRVSLPHNRFDGRRGAAGFLSAWTAFLVARRVASGPESIGAVIHVVDADNQGDERRLGQRQAREISLREGRFRIVIGCPDMEREAWLLAGFEPENDAERDRLATEQRGLLLAPCEEPHLLRDRKDHEPRSPKRVLRRLTGGDREREERCWTDAPLERLRKRGGGSGLAAFLDEVREHLVARSG